MQFFSFEFMEKYMNFYHFGKTKIFGLWKSLSKICIVNGIYRKSIKLLLFKKLVTDFANNKICRYLKSIEKCRYSVETSIKL